MLDATFYDLTQSLWGGLVYGMSVVRNKAGESPEPPPPLLQVQSGMAESPGWFLVQAAEFDPEPLTVANLRVRDVYASERIVGALLEMMAAEKWFERQGESYHLTDAGRSLMRQRRQERDRWMAALDPLLDTDIECLAQLLGRVVQASLASGDPPGNWCLRHSRHRAPAEDAAFSVQIFQYVADLNAFRDDAHMAAWKPYQIEGYVWESFSLVAGGQVDRAQALAVQLSFRGYSPSEYTGALAQLAERGWLETADQDRYTLSEKGNRVKLGVERLTDDYFYAPWRSFLNDHETSEVRDLMMRLRDELQGMK